MTAKDIVQKYVDDASPDSVNAQRISTDTGLNYDTVRRTLARLYSDGSIEREHRGLYHSKQVVETGQARFGFPEIHSLKIEHICPKLKTGLTCGCQRVKLTSPTQHIHGKNKSYIVPIYWESRKMTITYFKKSTHVFVAASDNPITPQEFIRLCGWIEGAFTITLHTWRIAQIAFSRDFKNKRLWGLEGKTMDIAQNAFLELYNKSPEITRLGTHLNNKKSLPGQIDLEQVLKFWTGDTPDLNSKVETILIKQTEAFEKMASSIEQLIDKLTHPKRTR
jgi:hypothetical protein